ncbi:hypothetical protein I551_9220 [Mycobacterium ulcerans str. Harvey]|uniref:Uncharacterized protein n=1 Tax=Mycobacterium ulcerans str. Harvey TaxID=1299332 RepID=A0ABN0R8S7_MYCUL|nr:hypothetical protein I551_9220 [Mycobacterium ulcerans str. Harvey]
MTGEEWYGRRRPRWRLRQRRTWHRMSTTAAQAEESAVQAAAAAAAYELPSRPPWRPR